MHRSRLAFFLPVIVLIIAACGTETPAAQPPATLIPVSASELQIVTGQTVYVPAYSEVFYGSADRTLALGVTLAIHNTDPDSPIIIQSVQFFDTDGNLVRDYIDSPVQVSPLATTGFVVEDTDERGGWGSNFIVRWGAETPVYEPVIEAVMVSARGNQGVSLISPGRVVSQTVGETSP